MACLRVTVNKKAVWIRSITHRVAHRSFTISGSGNFTMSAGTFNWENGGSTSTAAIVPDMTSSVTYAHAHYPVWEEQANPLMALPPAAWIQRLYLRLPDAA